MATLFDMYKDVTTPDVFNQTRAARQESEANTKKTMDTSFGMLKKSNIGTLQQQYRAGTGRFEGITDPDKKFQVYYDALKALDPQSAQDAAKVYGEERERRISGEIAAAYKGEGGDPELKAIEDAIKELNMLISSEEASKKATEEAQKAQEAQQLQAEAKATDNMELSREDLAAVGAVPLTRPAEAKATDNMNLSRGDMAAVGAMPLPREAHAMKGYTSTPSLSNSYSLKDYYSTDKIMPTNDISLSTVGEPVNEDEMSGYTPSSAYDKFKPRTLSSMYRGF